MFKKIVMLFLLIIVLAGISYVKTYREHQQIDQIYEQAKADEEIDTNIYLASIDSLNELIAENESIYKESLEEVMFVQGVELDSLNDLLLLQRNKIDNLEKQKKQLTINSSKKKSTQLSQHEKSP